MSRHRRRAARGGAAGSPLPLGPAGARRRPAQGRAHAAADCRSRRAPRPDADGPSRRAPRPAAPAARCILGWPPGLAGWLTAAHARCVVPRLRPGGGSAGRGEVAVRLERTPQGRLAPPSRASGAGPRRGTRGVGGRACPAEPPARARPSRGYRSPHREPRLRGGVPGTRVLPAGRPCVCTRAAEAAHPRPLCPASPSPQMRSAGCRGVDEVDARKAGWGPWGSVAPGAQGWPPRQVTATGPHLSPSWGAPPCSPPRPQPLPLSGPPPPGRSFQSWPALPAYLVRRGNPGAPLGEVQHFARVRACSAPCGSVGLLIEAGAPVFSSRWHGRLPRRLPQHSALTVRKK